MNASLKLNDYISSFAKRWRQLLLGRGLLIAISTFTLVSLIAALVALESGFDDSYFWFGRVVLIVATGLVVYFIISKPLKSLENNVANELEQRQPDFSGRINTFTDTDKYTSGLHELLANDALDISDKLSLIHI